MLKNFIDSLRQKSLFLSDLPETIRVPGKGGKPTIDGLSIEIASVDDLAFAIKGLEHQRSAVSLQLLALQSLYDLARTRGAVGTDRMLAVFGEEV